MSEETSSESTSTESTSTESTSTGPTNSAALLRRVGVIGGGTMGAGIAYVAARAGAEVRVAEPEAAAREHVLERIAADLDRDVARGRLDAAGRAAALGRITVLESLGDLGADLDLLVEAVPEVLSLKQQILAEAERLGPALLASNTSSISINALAEALDAPQNFVGMHFFNPVRQMALVEVVTSSRSAPSTVAAAVAAARELGKEPLTVADSPGFLTSRLGVLLGLEAMRMLEAGVAAAEDIDRAMVLGYGHPMGPLRLGDLVGLDVRLGIARVLEAAYGSRFTPPPLLEQLVAEGRLGQKSGRGIYDWPSV